MTCKHALQGTMVCAAVLLTTSSWASTLEETINKTIQTHPEIEVAKRNVMAIAQEWRQAKAGYFPTVNLSAASGWEHSNNSTTRGDASIEKDHTDMWRNESRLTVSQMLFDGFQTSSLTCQQAARYRSALSTLDERKEMTSLRAVQAYMDVLRTRELLALAKTNLKNHEDYAAQVGSRAEGGRGSQADVRQAEGRVALARANFITAKGDLEAAEADYMEAVGEAPAKLSAPKVPFSNMPATLAAALEMAKENNPALRSAMNDIDAANAARRESRAAFYPRFDMELSATRNHNLDGTDGMNNDATALVRMSYNLYNGGADTARRRERLERLSEAEQAKERDLRVVEQNVRKAWANYSTARGRLEPLSQHVLSSDQTRSAYRAQFDINQRSLLDLLDSEIEWYNAQTAMINGRYAVDFSVYEVLANAGVLLDTIHGTEAPAQVAQK